MDRSKSGDPGTFSEKVLILGMWGVRSDDFVFRSGFVPNPWWRTLICTDFLFLTPPSSKMGHIWPILVFLVLPTYNVPSNPYTLGQRIELGTKSYRVP